MVEKAENHSLRYLNPARLERRIVQALRLKNPQGKPACSL